MPRKKLEMPLPTPTERVQKSVEALVKAGGKRLSLRLTPEGYGALKTIMRLEDFDEETLAINRTLIERERQLLTKSTKQKTKTK